MLFVVATRSASNSSAFFPVVCHGEGVGLFDEAARLANQAPCDPRALTRAARHFAAARPEFAVEAGLAAPG